MVIYKSEEITENLYADIFTHRKRSKKIPEKFQKFHHELWDLKCHMRFLCGVLSCHNHLLPFHDFLQLCPFFIRIYNNVHMSLFQKSLLQTSVYTTQLCTTHTERT